MENGVADKNIVYTKSYDFALDIVDTYKFLRTQKEYILSSQMLRSGTSIGANIEEAVGSHSRKDFFYKITIAYKEARETRYWLKLLKHGGYLDEMRHAMLFEKCEELCRILGKIQLTLKQEFEAKTNK